MSQEALHHESQENISPSPIDDPASPQKAGSRDKVPLPEAARRIIRNQRGGGNLSMARHMQTLKKDSLLPLQPGRRMLKTQTTMVNGSRGRSRREPTVQEMYNTWRALEEQVDKIRRLPMFIKAERKFCHTCRILKIKCECFDYSELEKVYQERDKILKQRALHQLPFPEDTNGHNTTISPLETETGVNNSLSSLSLDSFNIRRHADNAGPDEIQWTPIETFPPTTHIREIDEFGHPVNDPIAATQNGRKSNFDFNTVMATSIECTTTRAVDTVGASRDAPKHVKFEIRPVVIAKEKIGAHSRRWRCQFGSSGKPGDPVCAREDDNMETIRRHYGREHGRHRYHKKPAIRTRCSNCDFDIDKQRPPSKCPGCKTVRGIWLREMSALIEVPVPLHTGSQDGSSSSPNNTTSDMETYSHTDICNNNTPLPVMAPPNMLACDVSTPRPSSSSSSGTGAPVMAVSMSSHYPQNFSALDNMTVPTANCFTYPLTPMTPLTPTSPITPPSPISITSGVFDVEPMTLFPYDPLGVADVHSQPLFADGFIIGGIELSAVGSGCEAAPSTVANGPGLYDIELSQQDSMASMQVPGLSGTINLADIQLQHTFMGLARPIMADNEMQMQTATSTSPSNLFDFIE